jgi:osmotically-inducible protein OsmY
VGGVRSLDDELRVNPNAPSFSGGDFALAARATAALAAQTGVNAARLRASARDGVVTIAGNVPSASIKQTALETVRKLDGVKHVVDKIHVGS